MHPTTIKKFRQFLLTFVMNVKTNLFTLKTANVKNGAKNSEDTRSSQPFAVNVVLHFSNTSWIMKY